MKKILILVFGVIILVFSIILYNSGSGKLVGAQLSIMMGQKVELKYEDSSVYLSNDLDNKMFKVILTGPIQNRFTFYMNVKGDEYCYDKSNKDLILLSQSEVEENNVESSNKDELILYVKYSDDIYQKIINCQHYHVMVSQVSFIDIVQENN